MKKTIAMLLLLLIGSGQLPELPIATPATQTVLLSEDGGGHRFGGRKEQNSHNRRSKRKQRQNGIGYTSPAQVENWAWMLPQIDWEKGGNKS